MSQTTENRTEEDRNGKKLDGKLLAKARTANSVQELAAFLAEEQITAAPEQVEALFQKLRSDAEALSDEDLADVAGGLSWGRRFDDPPF